uniref:Cytochrome b n=1 Tax=Hexamermis agrotis TaxID=387665 RepID=A2TN56_9BILA|nr:cytochrome b [Hexamermis agrotis]ABM79873.1 cytochrome b [Hexamermis agrotis]
MKTLKISLKTPFNLSYWWNLGSLLGIIMVIQIVSGVLLTLYYENSEMCFDSIYLIHIETFYGVLIHFIHLNLASLIFLLMYFHMLKGLIFNSFSSLKWAWVSGWMMMMLLMLSAFMGYVLPWGQMSLWGATVITNLLSAVPYLGKSMVEWIWGGYFVSNFTMKMFFSLHFLVPLLVLVLIMIHILILHYYGSSSPIGSSFLSKTEFNPMYSWKDLISFTLFVFLIIMMFMSPYKTSDPENFIKSNPMVSPIHIQPEWYFLQYYAILRAIPNKLGGVLFFVLALLALLMMPMFKFPGNLNMMMLWNLVVSFFLTVNLMLIWLGGLPVESPYLEISQVFTIIYFFWFMFLMLMKNLKFSELMIYLQ